MNRAMSQAVPVRTDTGPGSPERDRARIRMISICGWCQRVRDEAGHWAPMEGAPAGDGDLLLTHGVCPDCIQKHFPRRKAAA